MFSNNLSSIEGISVYPIIALIIFFAFFTGVIIWVSRMKKNYVNKMGNLPLENEIENTKISEN